LSKSIILSLAGDGISDDCLARQSYRQVARISGKDVVRIFGTRTTYHAQRDGNEEMSFDITKLSEAELIELNRRIVERLQLMRSAKNLTQLARFSAGMMVEFDAEDGRTITGTVARLNQKTATVIAAAGCWRVSPRSCDRCRQPTARPRRRGA
jgi:hypothetical protein